MVSAWSWRYPLWYGCRARTRCSTRSALNLPPLPAVGDEETFGIAQDEDAYNAAITAPSMVPASGTGPCCNYCASDVQDVRPARAVVAAGAPKVPGPDSIAVVLREITHLDPERNELRVAVRGDMRSMDKDCILLELSSFTVEEGGSTTLGTLQQSL